MTSPLIYLTDRTTIETDWACGMKRWWYKEEGGHGIVPTHEPDYYLQGRQIHEDFQRVVEGEDLESILSSIGEPEGDDPTREIIQRRRGWVTGFAIYLWPYLNRHFTVEAVEKEIVLARDPLWIACTPDLLLRERAASHRLINFDYKTVGMLGKGWVDYWGYAIQMHISMVALEEELGEPIGYSQVIGVLKGQERSGKLRHPYVWAYRGEKPDSWTPLYSPALTLTPLWEYTPSIIQWVQQLGEGEAFSLFPFSAPITLNRRLVDELVEQRLKREVAVAAGRESARVDPSFRASLFEARYSQCRPMIGAPCPYLPACHNAAINADPLGSGLFIPRTPHHEMELIGLED